MTIEMYDLAGAEDNRRFSPNCWRVRMALAHKGLAVETIPWRFTEKDAIAFSRQGKVPVIVDGDQAVTDSWTIANYLEITYPNGPSLFGTPQTRKQIEFVKYWDDKVLGPDLFPLLVVDIFNHLHEKDKEYFRRTREAFLKQRLEDYASDRETKLLKFRTSLAPFRETLNLRPFWGGNQPNFADYMVFGKFQWARAISPLKLLEPDDPIYGWREKMLDLYDGLARKAPGYDV